MGHKMTRNARYNRTSQYITGHKRYDKILKDLQDIA